jgi:hypothetical protein
MLGDGTAGLMVVSARGGEAIVQDPENASFPSMPRREALRALKRKRLALSTNGRPREDFTSRTPGTPVPGARL